VTTACCDPPSPAPAAGPCPCDCSPADPAAVAIERNRYFTGKYMTARDFRDEQSYFLTHERLHQRILHGSGIVCGLDVVLHPDPQCQAAGWVVITPGIAIDCFGRDVIVREPLVVNVARLFRYTIACGAEADYVKKTPPDTSGKTPAPDDGPMPADPPPAGTEFLIGVRYSEQCIEPVPVLIDETGCGERRTPNRIRETACPRYRPLGAGDCWGPPPRPCGCPSMPPDQPTIPPNLAAVLAPLCPCGTDTEPDVGFIPLAKCIFTADTNGNPAGPATLDTDGRRHLPGPLDPRHLTHICKTNWNHGAQMWLLPDGTLSTKPPVDYGKPQHQESYEQHHHDPHGKKDGHHTHECLRLWIAFDRRLSDDLPAEDKESDPIWFYRRILQVRYVTSTGDLLSLPGPARLYLSDDKTRLNYEVQVHCLDDLRKRVPTPVIQVTLNCDFLPDRWGRAVDGNHLKGLLAWKDDQGNPKGASGDGVEGGVFESWFQLHW
jgi:hypothetical protein